MATICPIDASPRNAAKPARLSAVQCGGASRIHSLALALAGEDDGEAEELIAAYYSEYAPATVAQRCLVERAIHAEYRLRQLYRLESRAIGELTWSATPGATALYFRIAQRIAAAQRTWDRTCAALRQGGVS
jgi:hypothetical protein